MKNDLSQAKKLIKECRKSQNPYLDLGYCGITQLKELPELFECTPYGASLQLVPHAFHTQPPAH